MYTDILVPIDGSQTSQCALAEAAAFAGPSHARIHLLNVVEGIGTGFETPDVYWREVLPALVRAGEKTLEDAASGLRASGIAVDKVLVESGGARVSELIVEQARKLGVDLIIMGTHGRHGLERVLMGSDAEQVARTSPVSVMLVRRKREDRAPKTG